MNMINYGNLSYHSEDNPLKVWWTCLEIIFLKNYPIPSQKYFLTWYSKTF